MRPALSEPSCGWWDAAGISTAKALANAAVAYEDQDFDDLPW